MEADDAAPAAGGLRLVERPAPWLRFGGGAFLIAGACVGVSWAAVAPEFRSRLGALLLGGIVGAALLALAAWWLFSACIEVAVGAGRIDLAAPGWHRRLRLCEVGDVALAADTGLNTGLLNWPVTRSGGVTRLNMGGRTAVEWAMRDARRYRVVVASPDDAHRLLAALS